MTLVLIKMLVISKLYHRHNEFGSKFNAGLSLAETKLYGDIVHKVKKIVGRNDFFWSVVLK